MKLAGLAALLLLLLGAAPGESRTVLIVGDSIVRGSKLEDLSDRWGEQVPGDVTVLGEGGSSATARRNNERIRWIERWSSVVHRHPDVLVIGLGTNDLVHVDAGRLCHVLGWFVSSAAERGIDARVLTILPTARGGEHDAERIKVNACLRETIPERLIDLGPAFGEVLAAEYDSGDGLHPNPAGHRLIAEVVAASL